MKIIRIILSAIVVFSITFTALYGKDKIGVSGVDTSPTPYKGVVTMWQIDSFEGGVGSRKQFLLKIARMYEKNNDGVLIMVINQTVQGAADSLNQGNCPDVISFGAGVEISNFGVLDVKSVSKGGLVGDKCYATAWCRGGYFIIYNPALVNPDGDLKEIESLLVSQGEFTQPVAALTLQGITAKQIEVKKPMDAYVKFVSGKTPYFLATQRDIFRLENRGFEFGAIPLTAYNDLYQYVSVTSSDQTKRFYAQDFVNYLLREEVQRSLSQIGMFSDFTQVDYQKDFMREMQTASGFSTVSAFIGSENLIEMQRLSSLAAFGDENALNKIKKLLV